jgi:hypothetical protein
MRHSEAGKLYYMSQVWQTTGVVDRNAPDVVERISRHFSFTPMFFLWLYVDVEVEEFANWNEPSVYTFVTRGSHTILRQLCSIFDLWVTCMRFGVSILLCWVCSCHNNTFLTFPLQLQYQKWVIYFSNNWFSVLQKKRRNLSNILYSKVGFGAIETFHCIILSLTSN